VTFTYAGILKLTDPTYLDPSSPDSVHAQMLRAAARSPIGPLVTLSAHAWLFTGLAIAFGELAVGVGTLLGLWTRLASLGGFLLALSFFLTVSWTTRPYFFGADIVFMFAWTPLILAGDGGVMTVLAPIRAQVREQLGVRRGRPVRPEVAAEVERRTALRTGVLAGTLAVLAGTLGAAATLDSRRRGGADANTGRSLGSPTTPAPSPGTPTPSSTSTAPGTAIGPASQVPVGGAASFTDATNGQPAYVVQPTAGTYRAFSAVCTHAGCTVEFQQGTFFCPCHASSFDGRTGAVLSGPAPAPLPAIPITVSAGTIYET
jgi:thiosulfate dehydrogenase [quinone] large subunit